MTFLATQHAMKVGSLGFVGKLDENEMSYLYIAYADDHFSITFAPPHACEYTKLNIIFTWGRFDLFTP